MRAKELAPQGAITTTGQLRLMIERGLPIFQVNGVYPSIVPLDVDGAKIDYSQGSSGRLKSATGEWLFFLADNNIGVSYNCNYLFVSRAFAEQFVAELNTDPHYIAERQEHLAECDAMDDYDDYYNDYYDDYDPYEDDERDNGF